MIKKLQRIFVFIGVLVTITIIPTSCVACRTKVCMAKYPGASWWACFASPR